MSQEMIAIVNEQDEVVGVEEINKAHHLGLLHRETYVYVINDAQRVLLQQRRDDGSWDHSAAGHFSPDETYETGAKRECEEELGIKIELSELHEIGHEYIDSISEDTGWRNQRFGRIFLLRKDIKLEEFRIQEDELRAVKYFNKAELEDLLKTPELIARTTRLFVKKYILKII